MFGSGMTNSALLHHRRYRPNSVKTTFRRRNLPLMQPISGCANTEGIRRRNSGATEAARKVAQKEITARMGAGRARKRHGFPVFERELHHRRHAQPRRRAPERPLVTSNPARARDRRCSSAVSGARSLVLSRRRQRVASVTCRPRSVSETARRRRSFGSFTVTKPRAGGQQHLDRRGVEIKTGAKMILRTRANFVLLARKELGLGQARSCAR